MPTYNNNIPQATDRLKDSQGSLLSNFQSIANVINLNHVAFNASGEGKHKFVEMPVQSPVPTTVAGEVGLYCQTSALTGVPALVFAPQSAGTPVEFTSSLQATNGWARLPSGILLKWGQAIVNPGDDIVTFPVAANIPAFSAPPFNVYLQMTSAPVFDPNAFSYVTNLLAIRFRVYSVARTSTATAGAAFSYLAIGV